MRRILANLLCEDELAKGPRWPGKKPGGGNVSKEASMAIGANQDGISAGQHNRAQRTAAVVTGVLRSAGTIITAQRKIDVRRLILPDHEAMTALVDNLVESIGKCAPRQLLTKDAVIPRASGCRLNKFRLFERGFQTVTNSG